MVYSFTKIFLTLFTVIQVYAFIVPPITQIKQRYHTAIHSINCAEEDIPYLDKIEKQDKKKIERLQSIRNNISKYLVDVNKQKNSTNTHKSSYESNPIMPIDFDTLFLNINNIARIYLPSDYDRAVFYMSNNKRNVFFVKSKTDKELIEKLIKFIAKPVKIIVICDKSVFTDKFGFLYSGQ